MLFTALIGKLRFLKVKRERENWSRVPDVCLTPRQTCRLTVGRNITSALTLTPEVNSVTGLRARKWIIRTARGLYLATRALDGTLVEAVTGESSRGLVTGQRSTGCRVSPVLVWLRRGNGSGFQEGQRTPLEAGSRGLKSQKVQEH
jgi:hypothetical protein